MLRNEACETDGLQPNGVPAKNTMAPGGKAEGHEYHEREEIAG
jgi:hypothetical protein